MTESMTMRALRKMMTPKPMLATGLEHALWTIEVQEQTIIKQRDHIRLLDDRIAKLEREADGLRSLI